VVYVGRSARLSLLTCAKAKQNLKLALEAPAPCGLCMPLAESGILNLETYEQTYEKEKEVETDWNMIGMILS